MNFLEKYEPKIVDDLIGYKTQIKQLEDILNLTPYKTIFVLGSNGCGKSTFVKMVLNALNFNIKFYNTVVNNNEKLIDEMINLNHNNILDMLNSKKTIKKHALVIDNFDHINLTNEKNLIENIISFNLEKKKFPLILISNINNIKIINEMFLEKAILIKLAIPNKIELTNFIDKIALSENKHIFDKDIYNIIINFSQNDLRRLLFTLQDIFNNSGEEIKKNDILELLKISEKKNIELGLFESYKETLTKSNSLTTILSLYNTDKVLLPLTFHENYIKDIFAQNLTITEINHLLAEISILISKGDIIETDIYTDQNWQLQDTHCFFSIYKPIYLLNKKHEYNSTNQIKYNISFSTELNKTSLKNINRKNLNNLNPYLKYNLVNILDLSFIINALLNDNRFDDVKKLLSEYCDDYLKLIEILTKIDKCNPNIFVLNTKIKKLLM
jgi:energy-coupling factor transporter ATP-binding protein EcfA2